MKLEKEANMSICGTDPAYVGLTPPTEMVVCLLTFRTFDIAPLSALSSASKRALQTVEKWCILK